MKNGVAFSQIDGAKDLKRRCFFSDRGRGDKQSG